MTQDINTALTALATRLNAEVAARKDGITAVVKVKASAILSLGFDEQSTITADTLRQALAENLIEMVQLTASDGSGIDSANLIEVRTEL